MGAELLTPCKLGEVRASTENPQLLGEPCQHTDLDYTKSGYRPLLSAEIVHSIYVQNTSGGNLTCGLSAAWSTTSGNPGRKIGAVASDNTPGAGLVDPYVPSGVIANLQFFHLITEGPALVTHDGNGTIVAGDQLVGATAGKFDKFDPAATAASENNNQTARAIDTPADDDDGTKFRARVRYPK